MYRNGHFLFPFSAQSFRHHYMVVVVPGRARQSEIRDGGGEACVRYITILAGCHFRSVSEAANAKIFKCDDRPE